MRLQILSTEHWSLLASRSLAWNESFSRAGVFLTTLTGAIMALALVAQASAFGEGFTLFALVILPVVLFIGVATYIRLAASNYHEAMCVIGMNRIRAAYLQLAPELERYFVMSAHDDFRGIGTHEGRAARRRYLLLPSADSRRHADGGHDPELGARGRHCRDRRAPGAAPVTGVLVGGVAFLIAAAAQSFYSSLGIAKLQAAHRPLFSDA